MCVITLYVSLCVARCCRCVLLPCMSPSVWRGVAGVCYYLVRLPLCGEEPRQSLDLVGELRLGLLLVGADGAHGHHDVLLHALHLLLVVGAQTLQVVLQLAAPRLQALTLAVALVPHSLNLRRKEGHVLFNDALNTFHLRLYGVRHRVKDHSDSEGRKGGNVLFNDALNTFYLRLYGVRHRVKYQSDMKEGNVLFNDALNAFYLRLYGIRHRVKDHSDSESGNPLPPHRLLFQISSKQPEEEKEYQVVFVCETYPLFTSVFAILILTITRLANCSF